MKTNQKLSILFWINTPKLSHGEAPIYVRVTIDSQRSQWSLGRRIDPEKWNRQAGNVKGNSEAARTVNFYINYVRGELQKHYNLLCSSGDSITAEMIRNSFLGRIEKKLTLAGAFKYHNLKMKEKIAVGKYSPQTLKGYKITLGKVQDFLNYRFRVNDKPLDGLNYAFITEFEHFLVTRHHLASNSAMKYLKYLKRVMNLAVSMEWIPVNPFQQFKCAYKNLDREILTQGELDAIYKKEFGIPRLNEVRDVFIFCCYTGFAYVDVAAFCQNAITTGVDGEQWLSKNREKTSSRESVPLLPVPLKIIEKYKSHPYCRANNKLLPVNSNQKYNGYLKEIAIICGINKHLTTHIARHTFATTVTLANGVPIETVSAMLGHRDLRTTQIYAKVIERKVSEDMQKLKDKYSL